MFYKNVLRVINLPFRLFFPFKTYGAENLPEGRVVVAGNHSSNADVIMVLLSMPWDGKVGIIGKKELFKWKPMGWFIEKMGGFAVDRGANDIGAVKKCLGTLKDEKRLIIFPEGTRVKGEESIEAKNGAALFAIKTKSPVQPVYITKGKKLFRKSKVIFGQPYYIEANARDGEAVTAKANEMMEIIYGLEGKY